MQKLFLSVVFTLCSFCVTYSQKLPKGVESLGKTINTKKYTEYAPSLSADGKILVYQSDNNRYRIWYLYESRLQANGKWSKPRSIESINHYGQKPSVGNGFQTDFISAPCLSPDGNTLYFCANFTGGMGKRDLYVAYRGTGGKWGKPQNLGAPVNTTGSEDFPSVSAEGDALYFARPNGNKRAQNTCYDLWVSQKDLETGNWQKPTKLPASINTGCTKCPRIQSDGLTLIYSSLSKDGKGDFDLYKAVLNVKQDGWEQLAAISELNSSSFDQFVTVIGIKKGTKAYYSTQGKKSPDIFQVNPLPQSLQLQQVINTTGRLLATKDGQNNYVLGNDAKLELYLLEAGEKPYLLKLCKADAISGGFALALRFGYSYKVKATAKGYEPDEQVLYLKDWSALDYALKNPLLLKKIEKVSGSMSADITGSSIQNKEKNLREVKEHLAKAQDKLFINPATGEVISQADLSQRWVVQGNVNGKKEGNPSLSIRSEGELMKAFPQFKPYETSSFIKRNGGKSTLLAKIKIPVLHFAYKSSTLDAQSRVYLKTVYDLMRQQPDLLLWVEAHTDIAGTWRSNLRLSEQRAQAVKKFLTKLGIEAKQIKVKGFGEARPLGINGAQNRRVELYFKIK
ncbi:OmpA family protein [uncultured Microscilla sp.]|uniref:OmpA family protein n=1 Tax=uncultured Microscilla sp. TaxID=432653 RepID=UPI0026113429|nr:OmpA family protein [uncultured Microscilla sp.]